MTQITQIKQIKQIKQMTPPGQLGVDQRHGSHGRLARGRVDLGRPVKHASGEPQASSPMP